MNSISIKLISFCIIAILLIDCTNGVNSVKDYDRIQESWDIFVEHWNQLDAEGCMTIYSDDAVLMPPQLHPLEGKQAIAGFYESLFSMNRSADYKHITESITFSKEQAIEVGSFSVNWVSNEGDSSTYHARAMVHWEKDQFGDWKIKKLLFNNSPARESES